MVNSPSFLLRKIGTADEAATADRESSERRSRQGDAPSPREFDDSAVSA